MVLFDRNNGMSLGAVIDERKLAARGGGGGESLVVVVVVVVVRRDVVHVVESERVHKAHLGVSLKWNHVNMGS